MIPIGRSRCPSGERCLKYLFSFASEKLVPSLMKHAGNCFQQNFMDTEAISQYIILFVGHIPSQPVAVFYCFSCSPPVR